MQLAHSSPSSTFIGYDPSASVVTAAAKAAAVGLDNLKITGSIDDLTMIGKQYDLIIASHVIEHLVDFDAFSLFKRILSINGLLYVEVPNAVRYDAFPRRSFLYYFDRLHVNHFSVQALTHLLAQYGFGYLGQREYGFPYADGNDYPALGVLFQKGADAMDVKSPEARASLDRYVRSELRRATLIADALNAYNGILVWGCGDNFYRSMTNGGPLSRVKNMVLLDSKPQEFVIGENRYASIEPITGLCQFVFPVAVTVSEAGRAIVDQIRAIDPDRKVFFL